METVVSKKETIIVKIGSEQIHDSETRTPIIETLKEISKHVNLIVVASGAVAEGTAANSKFTILEEDSPETTKQKKQAASTVGNHIVARYFADQFGTNNIASITISHADLADSECQENLVNTLKFNTQNDILTVINENDAIATAELTWGDNDQLAAHLATILEAEKLCLMTGEKGLVNKSGKHKETYPEVCTNTLLDFPDVKSLDQFVRKNTWSNDKQITTGGIVSKVIAGIRAVNNGVETYVLSGERPEDLLEILGLKKSSKQHWTKLFGSPLSENQQSLLANFIKKRQLKVPRWSSNQAHN